MLGFCRFISKLIIVIACGFIGLPNIGKGETYETAKASNCGLNCALVVLSNAKIKFHLEDVISELKLEPNLHQSVSFSNLAFCFRKYGLEAVGIKEVNISDLRYFSQNIFIIPKLSYTEAGHFIEVQSVENGNYRVNDYPELCKEMSGSEFISRYGRFWTGELLLISSKGILEREIKFDHGSDSNEINIQEPVTRPTVLEKTANDRDLSLNETIDGISLPKIVQLDASEMAQNAVTAKLPIQNKSARQIFIKFIKGQCSCYTGFDGDQVIAPNESKVLNLHFDISKTPAYGDKIFKTSLAIMFEGRNPSIRTVVVQAPIELKTYVVKPNRIKVASIDKGQKYDIVLLSRNPEVKVEARSTGGGLNLETIRGTRYRYGYFYEIAKVKFTIRGDSNLPGQSDVIFFEPESGKVIGSSRIDVY